MTFRGLRHQMWCRHVRHQDACFRNVCAMHPFLSSGNDDVKSAVAIHCLATFVCVKSHPAALLANIGGSQCCLVILQICHEC